MQKSKKITIKEGEADIKLNELISEFVTLQNSSLVNDSTKLDYKFPIEVFPEEYQKIIQEFYDTSQLPLDFFGLLLLIAGGGIAGNAFILEYRNGYTIAPVIYGALVGASSIGKTPVMKMMLAPVYKIEKSYRQTHQAECIEWSKRQQKLEKGEQEEAKPTPQELIINNATIEAVNRVHNNNSNGLILLQDELIGWINGLNQYKNGSDEQFWLSNWSSTPIKVNRVHSGEIYIPHPCISVVGGIQPSILKQLAKGDRKDNGFFYRIIFAFPTNQRKPYNTGKGPSKETILQYEHLLLNILKMRNEAIAFAELDDKDSKYVPVELEYSAKLLYQTWNNKNTDAINASEFDSLISFYGKLEQYCLRFALILCLLEEGKKERWDFSKPISINSKMMEGAIVLTEYFRKTGLRVMDIIDNVNPLSNLTEKKRKIYDTLPAQFTTKEGIAITSKCGSSERTFYRFIKNKDLFKRLDNGYYHKRIL